MRPVLTALCCEQVLQLLAEDHEIVLTPDILSDSVTLDGESIKLVPGEPVVFYKQIAYGQYVILLFLVEVVRGFRMFLSIDQCITTVIT